MPDRRVCVLTGAAGRLGNDFCSRYADVYDIVAVCRRRLPAVACQHRWPVDPLFPVPDDGWHGPPVHAIEVDLEDDDAPERIVETALARFGRIDLLVNAAVWVRHERLMALADVPDILDRHFRLNATIPVRLAATAGRLYWCDRAQDNVANNRNVVNISSLAGSGVVPNIGLGPYSASKSALNFLTCHLAEEFQGIGVRVNALAPTTFPDVLPTSSVSDEIVALDQGPLNGHIVELDERGVATA